MKIVIGDKVPEGLQLAPGSRHDMTPAEIEALDTKGCPWITAAEHDANLEAAKIKARAQEQLKNSAEALVKASVVRAKDRKAIAPKDEEVLTAALANVAALDYKPEAVALVTSKIDAMEAPKLATKVERITTSHDGTTYVDVGEEGFRETVKAYWSVSEPFHKTLKQGGIVRAANNNEAAIKDAVRVSQERARLSEKITAMIVGGANASDSVMRDIVKAGDYADQASNNPLGVLNTGLLVQQNLGFLSYQLAMLDDITTDISGQPVLFNQMVRSRYLTIPKVMLKTTTNAWPAAGAPTGTVVDVNVTMDTHAGVPISINNNVLGSTLRQLHNEQRAPQLYALGQYIIYKLLSNIWTGNTRYANDASTTSTITFSGNGNYSVAAGGGNLATFTADLPEALDELRFPGGDEEIGDDNLARFVWVHGRIYAIAAADTNFLLNSSIQGIRGQTSDNPLKTGRYSRIGNLKFRKSQLVTDNVTASGTGADSTTNGITVSAGSYAAATKVGFAGTRSSLLFVSRVPTDYTQVLPDVPSTAAIEMATEPKTGLTFMIVKFLDHAYETANLRVQLMFGTAIGDERQGLYIVK